MYESVILQWETERQTTATDTSKRFTGDVVYVNSKKPDGGKSPERKGFAYDALLSFVEVGRNKHVSDTETKRKERP